MTSAKIPKNQRSFARRTFLKAREFVLKANVVFYRRVLGMDVGDNVRISLRARMDFTNPRGILIGEGTYVAFDSIIFAHDMSRLLHTDTYIGKNCFVGAKAIVMPGVRVGDYCIVGSGAVVTKDVPSGSIVAGNPAKVIRSGIRTVKFGILEDIYTSRVEAELAAMRESQTVD